MTTLLPCPFCGSRDLTLTCNRSGWKIVECDDCGMSGPCVDLEGDEYLDRWNTRAAHSSPPMEELERVALAIEATMFAPHELPLPPELHAKYLETARAAIGARQDGGDGALVRALEQIRSIAVTPWGTGNKEAAMVAIGKIVSEALNDGVEQRTK